VKRDQNGREKRDVKKCLLFHRFSKRKNYELIHQSNPAQKPMNLRTASPMNIVDIPLLEESVDGAKETQKKKFERFNRFGDRPRPRGRPPPPVGKGDIFFKRLLAMRIGLRRQSNVAIA
jgi:hypothetical protein